MVVRRLALASALLGALATLLAPAAARADDATPPAPEGGDGLDDVDALLEEAAQDLKDELSANDGSASTEALVYPRFEHHGYFRFRADLFYNGHLGTTVAGDAASGTSAVPAPLTRNTTNQNTAAFAEVGRGTDRVIAGANIRLRYQPTLHLAESARIVATLDILDNLVLGSTPDFLDDSRWQSELSSRGSQNAAFSSERQDSPTAGDNGWRDAVLLKELYAEWEPFFLIRVGRQATDWGLGLLSNSGDDLDADRGDFSDRVLLAFDFSGVQVMAAYDFVFSGAVTEDPARAFGQASDLGTSEDIQQAVLTIAQVPRTAEQLRERHAQLFERLEPAVDWGVHALFRHQKYGLDDDSWDALADPGGAGAAREGDLTLVPIDAWALAPDLWLRYEQRFDSLSGLSLEVEAVGLFGEFRRPATAANQAPRLQEIRQFGGALEARYDNGGLSVGLDSGFATGDSASPTRSLGPGLALSDPRDPRLTAFRFDPDYHVDMVLFREVLGTVSNAAYVKPWISYDLFGTPDMALGARLDLEVAHALVSRATPGREGLLGVEADAHIFYEDRGKLNVDIEAGLLFPGPGLDYRPTDPTLTAREAEIAFTLQARLTLQF